MVWQKYKIAARKFHVHFFIHDIGNAQIVNSYVLQEIFTSATDMYQNHVPKNI